MSGPEDEERAANVRDSASQSYRRGFAMILMVIGSLQLSFGGLVIRSIEEADPWQINFYRSIGFMAIILVILVWRYRQRLPAAVYRIGRSGIVGGAFLAVAGTAFLHALTLTTVANTLFVISALPLITAFLAWIVLRERLSRATIVTMLAAALGLVIMVAESLAGGSFLGSLVALLSALTFAGYAVIIRFKRGVDMLPTLLIAAGAMILLSAAIRWGDLIVPWEDIWLGLLSGLMWGIANWIFIVASRHLRAAELTLFMLLEFALGPIWVWLFIGEIPGEWTVVGGVLVIGAVFVRSASELRRGFAPSVGSSSAAHDRRKAE